MPIMNKALSKEITIRTRLRNKFLKDRSEENKKKYSKQHNYCVSPLLRKSKLNYFESLNEKISMITKHFGNYYVLFIGKTTNKMTLIDNKEEIIVGDYNTAKVLNTFSSDNVNRHNITE